MNDASNLSLVIVHLKLQRKQKNETAHLVIGEEPMCLSTKEIVVPDSKHRQDDRHLFVEILYILLYIM